MKTKDCFVKMHILTRKFCHTQARTRAYSFVTIFILCRALIAVFTQLLRPNISGQACVFTQHASFTAPNIMSLQHIFSINQRTFVDRTRRSWSDYIRHEATWTCINLLLMYRHPRKFAEVGTVWPLPAPNCLAFSLGYLKVGRKSGKEQRRDLWEW